MHKGWEHVAESLVKMYVAWKAGQPFICPHDMTNFHGMVIDDASEMVGRVSIRLHNDEVVNQAIIENDITSDVVGARSCPLVGHPESDDRAGRGR